MKSLKSEEGSFAFILYENFLGNLIFAKCHKCGLGGKLYCIALCCVALRCFVLCCVVYLCHLC